jgi:hypothetical protein
VQRICENQGWSVSLDTMEPNGCRFSVDMGLRPAKDPMRLPSTNVQPV